MTGKNKFLDTSRIIQQQERKVARIDLLVAQKLDSQELEEEFGGFGTATAGNAPSLTTAKQKPVYRTD